MRHLLSLSTACLLYTIGLGNDPDRDPDWNQFRGGHGDGTASFTGIPTTWSETQHVAWKTAIWGKGWSSPVVWKNRIWLTTATVDGKRLAVLCLNRQTGAVLHDKIIFTPDNPQYCHPFNSYASSTPWVEDGRVYVHFGSLGTACLNADTCAVIWKRTDLPCNHFRGPASSIAIDGNRMFLPFDGSDIQYVAALDKQTGKTLWRTDRNVDFGDKPGPYRKAYSTARVITHEGRKQVIIPGAMATMSYDPASGQELWRVIHGGANVSCPPLFHQGVLYFTSGDVTNRLLAMIPAGQGNITQTHIKWSMMRGVPSRPSVLRAGSSIYMVSNTGVASCVDMETGRTRWSQRLGGKYSASPILVDKRIFCCEEEQGICHVFAADPAGYRALATNKLEASFMASPAVADKMLILRTKTHLYGITE
ncbi:MAG: PQQ-binding-like beta-propeller repeat protein [Pirellulales bacterium]|nr:PQQ-binding-like beta-propeller repeat protein [Pirellulales bacterium]